MIQLRKQLAIVLAGRIQRDGVAAAHVYVVGRARELEGVTGLDDVRGAGLGRGREVRGRVYRDLYGGRLVLAGAIDHAQGRGELAGAQVLVLEDV